MKRYIEIKPTSYYISLLAVILCYALASMNNNAIIIIGVLLIALVVSKAKLNIEKKYLYLLLFAMYCFLSSTWAVNSSLAISAGISYSLCVIFFVLICNLFYDKGHLIFEIIYSTSIIIGLISIIYYKPSIIFQSIIGIARLENTFCNVNLLGILFSYGILISFYKFLKDKKLIHILVIGFELLMLLSTQSRKALIIVILGIVGIWFIYTEKRIQFKSFIRLIIIVLLTVLLIVFLSKFSLFNAINERLNGLKAIITGKGTIDGSSMLRLLYIDVGMAQFFKHPYLGIGMDNARTAIIKARYNHDTYTHCNYVEMLCDGGIVGAILYYSFHAYILIALIKHRKYWNKYSMFCFVFLLILLIMDYGMVSYAEKTNWLTIAPVFLEIRRLKYIKKSIVDVTGVREK